MDCGLVMLDSLKAWRNLGWRVGAKKFLWFNYNGTQYDIHAFAQLDQSVQEVKASIYYLNGCYGGFQLPQSAMDQFAAGKPWEDVGDKNVVGGHAVTMCAYNETGPIGLTWGKRQQMTWKWYLTYNDEGYGVVDNKDRFLSNSPLDVEKLNSILKEITA